MKCVDEQILGRLMEASTSREGHFANKISEFFRFELTWLTFFKCILQYGTVNLFKIFCCCERYPLGIYLLEVNNKNTKSKCGICSKLTIKTPDIKTSLLLTLNIFHTLF